MYDQIKDSVKMKNEFILFFFLSVFFYKSQTSIILFFSFSPVFTNHQSLFPSLVTLSENFCCLTSTLKKSKLFGGNSLKMLILLGMNSENLSIVLFVNVGLYVCEKYVQLGNYSRKISVLVCMNSEKYVKFNNNSLKVPVLVYVNSEKYIELVIALLCMNSKKVSIFW